DRRDLPVVLQQLAVHEPGALDVREYRPVERAARGLQHAGHDVRLVVLVLVMVVVLVAVFPVLRFEDPAATMVDSVSGGELVTNFQPELTSDTRAQYRLERLGEHVTRYEAEVRRGIAADA